MLSLNTSGELVDHGRESKKPLHLLTHKRKRGRPKGSKNKFKFIYSVPTYKENKLSSPRIGKQIHLNISKEKSSFILAEINRKIQSQYAPWKVY